MTYDEILSQANLPSLTSKDHATILDLIEKAHRLGKVYGAEWAKESVEHSLKCINVLLDPVDSLTTF